jgi:hypothetical protein
MRMKRDTRAKIEDNGIVIGNIKVLGIEYTIDRILAKNKIHEEKFLVSVDEDGEVMYAIEGTAGEYRLLNGGNVIGYYSRNIAGEEVCYDMRLKPSLRSELTNILKELGFIRKLK